MRVGPCSIQDAVPLGPSQWQVLEHPEDDCAARRALAPWGDHGIPNFNSCKMRNMVINLGIWAWHILFSETPVFCHVFDLSHDEILWVFSLKMLGLGCRAKTPWQPSLEGAWYSSVSRHLRVWETKDTWIHINGPRIRGGRQILQLIFNFHCLDLHASC